jgi:hypothetical protein
MRTQDEADRALGAGIRKLLEYELAVNDGGLDIGRSEHSGRPYLIEGTLVTVGGRGDTLDEAVAQAVAKLPPLPED